MLQLFLEKEIVKNFQFGSLFSFLLNILAQYVVLWLFTGGFLEIKNYLIFNFFIFGAMFRASYYVLTNPRRGSNFKLSLIIVSFLWIVLITAVVIFLCIYVTKIRIETIAILAAICLAIAAYVAFRKLC